MGRQGYREQARRPAKTTIIGTAFEEKQPVTDGFRSSRLFPDNLCDTDIGKVETLTTKIISIW